MSSHIHRPHSGYVEEMDYSELDQGLVSSETVVYLFVLLTTGALLFLLVYFIITLSDLECDYLNAQQCCYRLNMWIVPKLAAHIVTGLILLLSGHFGLAFLSIPIAVFWAKEHRNVPTGNFGVFDPTEIHRMGRLKKHMKEVFFCIIFYLIAFFLYLYCFLTHLVTNNPRMPRPSADEDTTL